jgi:hypothetical protein
MMNASLDVEHAPAKVKVQKVTMERRTQYLELLKRQSTVRDHGSLGKFLVHSGVVRIAGGRQIVGGLKKQDFSSILFLNRLESISLINQSSNLPPYAANNSVSRKQPIQAQG